MSYLRPWWSSPVDLSFNVRVGGDHWVRCQKAGSQAVTCLRFWKDHWTSSCLCFSPQCWGENWGSSIDCFAHLIILRINTPQTLNVERCSSLFFSFSSKELQIPHLCPPRKKIKCQHNQGLGYEWLCIHIFAKYFAGIISFDPHTTLAVLVWCVFPKTSQPSTERNKTWTQAGSSLGNVLIWVLWIQVCVKTGLAQVQDAWRVP